MLFKAICAILSLVSFCFQVDGSSDPMVAFICNRPAMHSTDNGWVSDDSTGCLKDPTDILSYCQKVYPSLDIRNVIEGNKRATIGKWCDFGRTHCEQFSVLPFHCLVGPFQSDALLVPEHCAFHHIHEPKLCALIDNWKVKSEKSCSAKGMTQHSYGMLQPCGVSKFSGIEFVCCAPNQTTATNRVSVVKAEVPEEKTKASVKSDDFDKYVNKPAIGRKWNEREYYMKAKNDMKKYHQDKVAKMMKDWATARQRVESLKAIDLKASEKLSKEITSRFQMMYKAEESEKELERKQLEQLHDQRIQAQLSSREQQIFEDFMAAVDDNNIQPAKVVRLLRRYIRALQKDRVHAVGLYTRLRETDPHSADRVRKQTMSQLEGIERQLKKALLSLDRLSKQKNNIRRQIALDLDNYYALDDSISTLLLKPLSLDSESEASVTSTMRPSTNAVLEDGDYDDDDYDDDDDDDNDDDDEDDIQKVIVKKLREHTSHDDYIDDDVKDYDDDSDDDDDDDEEDDDKEKKTLNEEKDKKKKGQGTNEVTDPILSKPQTVPSSSSSSSSPLSPVTIVRPFPGLSGDIEDDYLDDYIHVKRDNHPDHINKNKLHVQQPHIQKAVVKRSGSFSSAVPLGIAVSGVTIFVVIVVGVVVMRRRARRSRPTAPDVRGPDPGVSPDEHNVSSMQMNGYENPTYKYLDGSAK